MKKLRNGVSLLASLVREGLPPACRQRQGFYGFDGFYERAINAYANLLVISI
jgi:hypothetical protein